VHTERRACHGGENLPFVQKKVPSNASPAGRTRPGEGTRKKILLHFQGQLGGGHRCSTEGQRKLRHKKGKTNSRKSCRTGGNIERRKNREKRQGGKGDSRKRKNDRHNKDRKKRDLTPNPPWRKKKTRKKKKRSTHY